METINNTKEVFFGKYIAKGAFLPERREIFDYARKRNENSPYWLKHGFKVPMTYADYYSHLSGSVSDEYLSPDLYYFYILPCLNRRDYVTAYCDKNEYDLRFKDFRRPETVVKNRNGIYYGKDGRIISEKEAMDAVCDKGECIIKPTIGTCGGVGVKALNSNNVKEILKCFESNKFSGGHRPKARVSMFSLFEVWWKRI